MAIPTRGRPITDVVLSVLILILAGLHSALGAPLTIKYDSVKNLQGSASIGRGYTFSTNSLQSTCMNITSSTISQDSYNYEYYFTDFTKYDDPNVALGGKLSESFALGEVKAALDRAYSPVVTGSSSSSNRYVATVTMRVERYFSGQLDEDVKLSDFATQMVEDKSYVSFFTTCGGNYIQSVKRAQEVTAIFNFEAADKDRAKEFAEALRRFAYGNSFDKSAGSRVTEGFSSSSGSGFGGYEDIQQSLFIEILAYGLGDNPESVQSESIEGENDVGLDAIVATSIEEFKVAMKSSLTSMTMSNDDDGEPGMVYVMEVVPWANNAQFLSLSEINEDNGDVYLPVPEASIENQRTRDNEEKYCVSSDFVPDDFGKCCKEDELVEQQVEEEDESAKQKCEPKRLLPAAIMKNNMESNAEFVSWLGSVAHSKIKTLAEVSQCAIKLRTLPPQYDYYLLDSGTIEMDLTVQELRMALDPLGDLNILTLLSKERDEFYDMFYDPCLSALYGLNLGENRETDPVYFTAKAWYNHPECMRASCLQPNKAWDRTGEGNCVDGVLRHTTATRILTSNDTACSEVFDPTIPGYVCAYTPDAEVIARMDQCRESLPQGENGRGQPTPFSYSYLVDNFCAPKINFNRDRVGPTRMDEIDATSAICRGE